MKPTRAQGVDANVNPAGNSGVELSARELEIVRQIADGKSSKQIAARLGISRKTVESHRTNIYRKLNVHSVAELLRYAIRHGLVEL